MQLSQKLEESSSSKQRIYEANIKKLMTAHYPSVAQLSEETKQVIIEQLTWAQENTQFTPQADVKYDASHDFNKHLNRETFRALTRIEQLLLLNSSDENHYEQFIADQSLDVRLSRASYDALKKSLQVNQQELDALIRATLIASVPLSPPAKDYLKQNHKELIYPYDSV